MNLLRFINNIYLWIWCSTIYACLSLNCELKTETMCFLHCIVCDDNAVWSLRQVGQCQWVRSSGLNVFTWHMTISLTRHVMAHTPYTYKMSDIQTTILRSACQFQFTSTELNSIPGIEYWIPRWTEWVNTCNSAPNFIVHFIIVIIRSKQIVANIHIHRKQLFFCARNRKTHEQISNLSSIIDLLWKLDNEENTTKKNIDTR